MYERTKMSVLSLARLMTLLIQCMPAFPLNFVQSSTIPDSIRNQPLQRTLTLSPKRNQKGTSNISREGGWRLLEHGPVAFPKRQSDRQREYAELRTDPSSAWCLVIKLIGEILRNALRSKV